MGQPIVLYHSVAKQYYQHPPQDPRAPEAWGSRREALLYRDRDAALLARDAMGSPTNDHVQLVETAPPSRTSAQCDQLVYRGGRFTSFRGRACSLKATATRWEGVRCEERQVTVDNPHGWDGATETVRVWVEMAKRYCATHDPERIAQRENAQQQEAQRARNAKEQSASQKRVFAAEFKAALQAAGVEVPDYAIEPEYKIPARSGYSDGYYTGALVIPSAVARSLMALLASKGDVELARLRKLEAACTCIAGAV